MKLSLTVKELSANCSSLQRFVREQMGLPPTCEVEILESPANQGIDERALPVFVDVAKAKYAKTGRFACYGAHPESEVSINMIAAIKELRTVIPGLGLAEAKQLVEKWRDLL
jgi:hypothetical protein